MHGLVRRIAKSVRNRGVTGSVSYVMPWVKERYEMWRWDLAHGVETRGRVSLSELAIDGPNTRFGRLYQGCSNRMFTDMMAVAGFDPERFTFIDYGSGKGKALLLASEYPFHKIVGVEFSSELTEMARENAKRFRSAGQRCRNFEFVCMDAAQYEPPPEPLVLYFFNPFNETLMAQVLDALEVSLRRCPREVHILYLNPVWASVFDGSAEFERVRTGSSYVLFRSVPQAKSASGINS